MTGQPAGQPAPNAATNRLVGRQAEWAKLQALWRAVLRGQSQVVLVYGEAGIGKSRLLEELLHWAGQQGIATAQSRSYAAEGALAYAPVIDWLRSEALQTALHKLEPAWLAELARLLPELAAPQQASPRPAAGNDRLQRLHLHEALARALCQAKQPLLLVIDDLQWCDPETIEWLHYFVRSAQQSQVLLIGAARPEELADQHPLHPFLVDLRIAGLLTEMELGPLTVQETSALATAIGAQSLQPATLDQIYQSKRRQPAVCGRDCARPCASAGNKRPQALAGSGGGCLLAKDTAGQTPRRDPGAP